MASTTTKTTTPATEQDGVSLYPPENPFKKFGGKGKASPTPFIALIFEGDEEGRKNDEGDALRPFLVALRKKGGRLCHSSYILCPCEEHWTLETSTPIGSFGYVKVLLAVMVSRFGESFMCHTYMVLNDNGSDNYNNWDKVHVSGFSYNTLLRDMLVDLVDEL